MGVLSPGWLCQGLAQHGRRVRQRRGHVVGNLVPPIGSHPSVLALLWPLVPGVTLAFRPYDA